MKRLWMVCFLIVVSSFVFAYSSATPDPGHGAENVFVYVNGQNLGLQSAIDSGKFGAYYTGGSYSGSVVSGHDDNIFVRVSGIDKSLQQAINDGSLCASGSGSGSPSGSVVFGHKGDDVLIDFGGEKSLQQAINEGLFGRDCVVPVDCAGYWNYNYGSCSATACGTTGRYDKLWTTTTSAANGGTACPSPTFVNNGGNSCISESKCDYLAGSSVFSFWGTGVYECSDSSVVSEGYKAHGRCGENAGLNYWKNSLSIHHESAMDRIEASFAAIAGTSIPNTDWKSLACSLACSYGKKCFGGECQIFITNWATQALGEPEFDASIKVLYWKYFGRNSMYIDKAGYDYWWAVYKSYGGGYDSIKASFDSEYLRHCSEIGLGHDFELCNDAISCRPGDDYIRNTNICVEK